jgi:hypothetical protein
MWAINSTGREAGSQELLERMHAADIHSTYLSMRDGRIHNFEESLSELSRLTRDRFGTPVDHAHLTNAFLAAAARTDGEYELRADIFRAPHDDAQRVLIVGREHPTRLPGEPLALTISQEKGAIADPPGASLCFVSNGRYVWPDSAQPCNVTGMVMSDRLRDTGYKSVRLTVPVADIGVFDSVFLVTVFGPVPVCSLDDQEYPISQADTDILMNAFESGSWMAPSPEGVRAAERPMR